MGDSLFGVVGKDCVILAADSHVDAHGIINMVDNVDKIYQMDDDKIFASSGPQGDRTQFMEFVQKNIHLYTMKNGVKLSPPSAAAYVRSELATLLRKSMHQCDLLCAGWDEKNGPTMHFVDYMAGMANVKRAAHGYGGYFTLGLLDRYWTPDMSEDECMDVIKKCIVEANTRLTVNKKNYTVKIVDKNGIRIVNAPA